MNTFNQLIVEPNISMRAMRTDRYETPKFLNFLIPSNQSDPVEVSLHREHFSKYRRHDFFVDEPLTRVLEKILFSATRKGWAGWSREEVREEQGV
jgi:hypothetical protein